ncbi:MAG: SDR family oxidoreductase, partial [Gammaproteobacteria bacterium]|nr:SDR family oxidoreductase [Gammaproteobacteria bacterium]
EPLERIDLLVNCAGSFLFGAVDEVPVSEWEDLFGPRFFGQMRTCHYAVPKMPAGSVIMLCSGVAAKSAIVNYAGGAGLCGAVNSMGKQLALELAPREIRVNVLSPGLIMDPEAQKTLHLDLPENELRRELIERIPMGRPGFPEDIAEAAMFFATCDYATGMVLDVDGGWTTT